MTFNFPETEKKILDFWQKNKIFEKLKKKNQGKKHWSFLDGPITANNPMGVHHAWGRTYKDLFQRYKAMRGFDQRFQNGFDCQGLWVEVEVEKEHGFKSKKDIEKFGIADFVNACKERVLKYSKIQTEQSIRLGQWMDWENSYYTMSEENNYAIWNFLKKCWEKGLLYKGRDVVPWCPRCGTAISQHEILTEEYKEIVHRSVFLKLEVLNRKKTFFLVWTTTPWTLPANVALAVNPEFVYAEVEDRDGNVFICLKNKAALIPDGRIIKEFAGRELENVGYKGMFDELPAVKENLKDYKHSVVLWEDVTEEEGTGIVHIAPGCGQEDFQLSKKKNLPVIDPSDSESKYKEGFGFLTGKLVAEAAELIFEELNKKGLVVKIENYKHRYPTCWRCKSELIFRLVDEWYISMDKLRKPLMEIAKRINWIPSFGLQRELDWLRNMDNWLISKKRYWGLALPIYECWKCGSFEVIGSKEELKKRAVSGWEKFEGHSPHRPWVDEVKIKCSKCGEVISRISDVGNPWLDAGIVPFSTMKYYSDREYWKKWFPADLVCESFPGQFKNWFYAMIVMSAVLEDSEPTKTIFGYASVRDEKGEEMHKSKGNAIWFDEAVEKIGADPMRWMYARQNPAYNLNFGYKTAEEIKRKLLVLYNIFVFFDTYLAKEKELFLKKGNLNPINLLDRWIISRLNSLIEQVAQNLDKYDVASAIPAIEEFFIDDLSLWYLRRSRKRFRQIRWLKEEEADVELSDKDKLELQEGVRTFYYVLLNLIKIMSPIIPFFTEEMYSRLRLPGMPESIHLFDWPEIDKEKIDNELEEEMRILRNIISQALAERANAGIKIRQPVASLKIKNQLAAAKIKDNKELLDLIKEEVNVKEIIFDSDIQKEVELDAEITPELKKEGILREIIHCVQMMRKEAGLKPEDKISIQYKGDSWLDKVLTDNKNFILEKLGAEKFELKKDENFDLEKEIKIDEKVVWLGLVKL